MCITKFDKVTPNRGMNFFYVPKFQRETCRCFGLCSIACSDDNEDNPIEILEKFRKVAERNALVLLATPSKGFLEFQRATWPDTCPCVRLCTS